MRLFCKHDYRIFRILHGDLINEWDGKRFWYLCEKCGNTIFLKDIKDTKDWEWEEWWAKKVHRLLYHCDPIDYNVWDW